MPRDYKHRAASRRKPKGKAAPGWVWLLAGLLVGLFVAFLVYLKGDGGSETAVASLTTETVSVPPAGQDVRDVRRDKVQPIPPPPKPRFDFYTILPQLEVVVPEEEITGSKKQGVRQVEKPGTYLLQAGSFRTYDQADKLKAQLALLGLHTSIQSAAINAQDTWHRVRVGPFDDLDELHEVRVQLASHDIQAILIRVDE